MNELDIDLCNKRFGAPGRIAFRPDEAGTPVVVLVNAYGSCEVSLHGARVVSYRPTGHMPLLFTTAAASRDEGGQPPRGGVPVLWPWTGDGATPALPRHGFARLQRWHIQATEYTGDTTELRLSLTDSEATRQLWPHAFDLCLRVWLDQRLNLALTTRNRDTHPVTFSQSLQPYLRVRQIMDVNVRGLEGAAYSDRISGHSGVQDGALNIRSETDRVFTPPAPECVLHDPGIGRVLAMTFAGATELTAWNPWQGQARPLPDFGNEDYTRTLALGPANSPDHPVRLDPGGSHTLTLSLQATLT